jgi:hypothetical protein
MMYRLWMTMVQLVRVWSSNLPRHFSNISSSSEILCRHAYGEAETHSAQLLRAPLVSPGWGANLAEHCTKTQMVLTCLTERVEWPQFMQILMRKMISDEIYWDFGVPCFKTNPDLSWSFSREKTRFVNQAGLSQSSNDVFNPSQTADKWCTQFEKITHKVVDITTSMSIYNMEVSKNGCSHPL